MEGPEVTQESSFRGLVLDYQVLKQREAKNLPKLIKIPFLSVFLSSSFFKTQLSITKPLKLDSRAASRPPGTHGHPTGRWGSR